MQSNWQTLLQQTVHNQALLEAYEWTPFASGSCNEIFMGHPHSTLDTTVILRLNAPEQLTPGVNRQREAFVLEIIQAYQWAPQILRNSPEQGWCLMKYYANTLTVSADLNTNLPVPFHHLLLNAIDELHAIDPTSCSDSPTDYNDLLDKAYLQKAETKQDTVALQWLASIKEDISALPLLQQSLVHHDLHLGNLIISEQTARVEKRLTILDWEYASIGNPWFDASCLSRYLGIPSDKIHSLKRFKSMNSRSFELGLKRANQMTETLQALWYRTREA